MNKALRFVLVLGLICLVMGSGVAIVYAVFKDRIAQNDRARFTALLAQVLPPGEVQLFSGQEGADDAVYVSRDRQGNILGYAATGEGQGYSSKVKVLVGLKVVGPAPAGAPPKLLVNSVEVLSQGETPGLGANISETTTNYTLWQKVGVAPAEGPEAQTKIKFMRDFQDKAPAEAQRVDAMTAATITSNAVKKGVEQAVARIDQAIKDQLGAPTSGSQKP